MRTMITPTVTSPTVSKPTVMSLTVITQTAISPAASGSDDKIDEWHMHNYWKVLIRVLLKRSLGDSNGAPKIFLQSDLSQLV